MLVWPHIEKQPSAGGVGMYLGAVIASGGTGGFFQSYV